MPFIWILIAKWKVNIFITIKLDANIPLILHFIFKIVIVNLDGDKINNLLKLS